MSGLVKILIGWAQIAAVLTLWGVPEGFAQADPIVARVASTAGTAWVASGPAGAQTALTAGFILNPGDRLDTRPGGSVVIALSDGSMVVVEPRSLVLLKDFRAAASLRELFEITLGIVLVKINHFAGQPNPYRMNSPTASIAVRGTEFTITVAASGETRVVVLEGVVEVSSLLHPEDTMMVEEGQGVQVRAGEALRRIVERSPGQALLARDDSRASSAAAGVYNRYLASLTYLASLSDITQTPLALRFNAFAENHLDALENPAMASIFNAPEARIYMLEAFSRVNDVNETSAGFGPAPSIPGNFGSSPHVSFFSPIGASGYSIGGSLSNAWVGNSALTSQPEYDPTALKAGSSGLINTTGKATSQLYSGSLVIARRFGENSFGAEYEILDGEGSLSSLATDNDSPGVSSAERIVSVAENRQSRFTLGYSRTLGKRLTLGAFHRYGLLSATDRDTTHTVDNVPAGLNSTVSRGHSNENGLRVRGQLSPRLSIGVTASWLGISLREGLTRVDAVDSHQADRATRSSLAFGFGYVPNRRFVVTFDAAGGLSNLASSRLEDATGLLLQQGSSRGSFLSGHLAIQTNITQRLFVSASFLSVWHSGSLKVSVYPDQYGNTTLVQDAFFPISETADLMSSRYSDFSIGWRLAPDFFAESLYSTDFGFTRPSFSFLLSYTLKRHQQETRAPVTTRLPYALPLGACQTCSSSE